MKRLVIDASVTIKWLLPDRHGEEHVQPALELLRCVQDGSVELLQPPHWLVEVGAVLARLEPELAVPAMRLLDAMDIPICHDMDMYARGIELSVQLDHHLFDTLYHAVALGDQADALVTADMRYFRKAANLGHLMPLAEISLP